MHKRLLMFAFFLVLSFITSSCLNDKYGDKCGSTYYYSVIRPYLITNCAKNSDCHAPNSNGVSDYTKYTEVFNRRIDMLRRVSLDPNESDFMPKGGQPLSAADIQMLKDWVANGAKGCDN